MEKEYNFLAKQGYSILPVDPSTKKMAGSFDLWSYQVRYPQDNQWYGIITGKTIIGGMVHTCIDIDSNNEEATEIANKILAMKETYFVKSPHGYHLHYKTKDVYQKRVKRPNSTLSFNWDFLTHSSHIVGGGNPGYDSNGLPIAFISHEELVDILKLLNYSPVKMKEDNSTGEMFLKDKKVFIKIPRKTRELLNSYQPVNFDRSLHETKILTSLNLMGYTPKDAYKLITESRYYKHFKPYTEKVEQKDGSYKEVTFTKPKYITYNEQESIANIQSLYSESQIALANKRETKQAIVNQFKEKMYPIFEKGMHGRQWGIEKRVLDTIMKIFVLYGRKSIIEKDGNKKVTWTISFTHAQLALYTGVSMPPIGRILKKHKDLFNIYQKVMNTATVYEIFSEYNFDETLTCKTDIKETKDLYTHDAFTKIVKSDKGNLAVNREILYPIMVKLHTFTVKQLVEESKISSERVRTTCRYLLSKDVLKIESIGKLREHTYSLNNTDLDEISSKVGTKNNIFTRAIKTKAISIINKLVMLGGNISRRLVRVIDCALCSLSAVIEYNVNFSGALNTINKLKFNINYDFFNENLSIDSVLL